MLLKFILSVCSFYSYKLKCWRFINHVPSDIKKYVLIAIPHTSNWDTYYAITTFYQMKVPVRFAIKKEWLKFPFGLLLKPLGAIGVDRSKKTLSRSSFVDQIVKMYNESEELILCITPEGTRKYNDKWRSGFYNIAVKAKVPIAVGVCDYKNKITTITQLFYPTGNYEADLLTISQFYKPSMAKFPENFAYDRSTLLNKM